MIPLFMYDDFIVLCEGQYRRTEVNVFVIQIVNVNTSSPFPHECISSFLHVYALGFKYVFRDDISVSFLNTYLAHILYRET